MEKVAIISADFGSGVNYDLVVPEQINCKYIYEKFIYDDHNSKSRAMSLHPRTKSKIPKMLQWLETDADYYIWLDSKFKIKSTTFINDIVNFIGDSELMLFAHPHRSTIKEEYQFVESGIKNGNAYLFERYDGEKMLEQINNYLKDLTFIDNKLFALGFFIYSKKLIENHNYNLMTDWFFHNCFWSIQDQLSLPYLLHKHKTKYKIFEFGIFENSYVTYGN